MEAAHQAQSQHDKRRKGIALVALIGIFGLFAGTLAVAGGGGDDGETIAGAEADGENQSLVESDGATDGSEVDPGGADGSGEIETDAGTDGAVVPAIPGAAELVKPEPGASVSGETECPAEDGSSERTTSFEQAPPMCIDPDARYLATIATTMGDIEVELDPSIAPETVNNFVTLARYQYFDGVPFHRIVPDFVIQGGDPVGEPFGTGGPGYTIDEEPPTETNEQGTLYAKYDLAMAKTPAPSSTGSQFFIVTGRTDPLDGDGSYSLFGRVLPESYAVVDAIGAVPGVGPTGDTPSEAVVMESVTIVEADPSTDEDAPAGDVDSTEDDAGEDGAAEEGAGIEEDAATDDDAASGEDPPSDEGDVTEE